MVSSRTYCKLVKILVSTASILMANLSWAIADKNIDYLSFAQGVVPIAISGDAKSMRVGMGHALLAIDENSTGFALSLKPGSSNTRIVFEYKLPALTIFSDFAIPNILETPSPSQTFIKTVEITGSLDGTNGSFSRLAIAKLETHAKKNQLTTFEAITETPVQWIRLKLSGGIDIQREKSFFEFSEIVGHGSQEPVPMLKTFNGKWKGRGVKLELKQDGSQVNGCYDREGDLIGAVEGSILRATGKTRTSGVASTFVLTVTDGGGIIGVRSTNGSPFRLYNGESSTRLVTECSNRVAPVLGCGAILHGINFDFDSAKIRIESVPLLDSLYQGLASETAMITVIGHTSNEGSEIYNQHLSQRRAESVVASLIKRGIKMSSISGRGLGESKPIADNATGAGRSLNRRVEIACH